jgi:hypothetical protein
VRFHLLVRGAYNTAPFLSRAFKRRFHFAPVIRQQLCIGRFESHHQDGLRI